MNYNKKKNRYVYINDQFDAENFLINYRNYKLFLTCRI